VFARDGFEAGKPTHEVIRLRQVDGKRIEFRTDSLHDTQLAFKMSGVLTRK
jgi:hypothetical protein